MESWGIIMNFITLTIHMIASFIAFVILVLTIYRMKFNHHYRRSFDARMSSTIFNDNASLIVIANTYFILMLYSLSWILLASRTFFGDFSLLDWAVHKKDSIICRLEAGMIFFLTNALYYSFFIQGLSRFFNVILIGKLNSVIFLGMRINGFWFNATLIFISWILSVAGLVPAFTIIDVFAYFPAQYHCLISFTNLRGFIYSLLVCYIIPLLHIWFIYCRIVVHVRKARPSMRMIVSQNRENAVTKHVSKICFSISILGLPTIILLCYATLSDETYYMADRFHELCLSVEAISIGLFIARLNSLGQILPQSPLSNHRNNRSIFQETNF